MKTPRKTTTIALGGGYELCERLAPLTAISGKQNLLRMTVLEHAFDTARKHALPGKLKEIDKIEQEIYGEK